MKKLICAFISATVALSLAGCAFTTPSVALTVNDTEINAGLYLIFQHQAYSNAEEKKEDAEKDLLKQQIEGVDAAQWIHNSTLDSLKRYVYVEKAFEENTFTFSDEEKASMQAQADSWFTQNEKVFAKNGIGKKSYDLFFTNALKESKLLSDKFAKEEANVFDDAAIKKYTNDNYTHVASLLLPSTDNLYQPLTDENKAKIDDLAKELVESVNGGAAFTKELAQATLEKAFKISGHEATENIIDQYFSNDYLSEAATSKYPEDITKEMMAAQQGVAKQSDISGMPMVWAHVASFETDEDFSYYRPSILAEMQKKAFDEMVLAQIKDYTVAENADAIKAYSLKKVKLS